VLSGHFVKLMFCAKIGSLVLIYI